MVFDFFSSLIHGDHQTLSILVGLLIYPVIWWQFSVSKDKSEFLVANFISSLIFAAAAFLVDAQTAAMVSLAAGFTSLIKSFISNKGMVWRFIIAMVSISVAVWIAPPQYFFDWVAVGAYFWVRAAESQKESIMRVMFIISPILWILILSHAGAYSVVPADVLGAYLAISWVVNRLDSVKAQTTEDFDKSFIVSCNDGYLKIGHLGIHTEDDDDSEEETPRLYR